uniref:Uncharacterized protein n=1 Tax=Anguilla anguilla TaxID=7936 RepID=A0A0E9W1A7_ANGAN
MEEALGRGTQNENTWTKSLFSFSARLQSIELWNCFFCTLYNIKPYLLYWQLQNSLLSLNENEFHVHT